MAARTKATARQATYPVETLRMQVSALEAAIAQTLARPKKIAVHGLRKSTRKIEAQLDLMAILESQEPGFAKAAKPAKRVRKLLKELRRAAGKVRDLDVQRDLAKEVRKTGETGSIRSEAKELRRELKQQRAEEADALLDFLKAHAMHLEPCLEQMMQALEPMSGVGLSATDLEVLTRDFYRRRRLAADRERKPAEQMHGARKAAKLARYMAEDGVAGRAVQEFETMQETGGRWHDMLTLRDAARERVGKKSELAELLKDHEEAARKEFRGLLAG